MLHSYCRNTHGNGWLTNKILSMLASEHICSSLAENPLTLNIVLKNLLEDREQCVFEGGDRVRVRLGHQPGKKRER